MLFRTCAVSAALCITASLNSASLAAVQEPVTEARSDAQYLTYAGLTDTLHALASRSADRCDIKAIGTSIEGRSIWAFEIKVPGAVDPDDRPGLLIVGGIDGHHLVGSECAVDVIETLFKRLDAGDDTVADLLTKYVVYVVPRVNPDGMERYFNDTLRYEYVRNARPDDQDRDTVADDDGPDDLNGDGIITQMRVYDPVKADMMADEKDPRLNASPDRDKGQRAAFYVIDEGRDNDGDGVYGEDPLGGVDLNMNYMHGYVEHKDGAGIHQVSEPESLALLRYVLDHQNIAAVVVYGRHDTLVNPPDGNGNHPSGAPKNLDSGDTGLYKAMSEKFKEITGLTSAPRESWDGSFVAWAYAQFGVPAFSTTVWTRPEPEKKVDKQEDKQEGDEGGEQAVEGAGTQQPERPSRFEGRRRPGGGMGGMMPGGRHPGGAEGGGGGGDETLTPSGIGDISQQTIDELLAAAEAAGFPVTGEMMASMTEQDVERYAQMAGVQIRRVSKDGADGEAQNKEDFAWLKYSDEQREGAGFLDWTEYDHPQLGHVEIGGWVPYFKTNPPAADVPALAEKQCDFVIELLGRFPDVSLMEPEITRLAPGLYEVKAALVNDGWLPAGTAMARRNQRARPYVVRLSTDDEDMVTGQRIERVWSLAGSGGREDYRWIIKAPDDSDLTITVFSDKYGEFERTVKLTATK